MIEQHEANTEIKAQIVVADHKYGTQENYVACAERGLISHMGEAAKNQHHARSEGIFPDAAFTYDAPSDTYRCPAGETLKPRRIHPVRRTMEYKAAGSVCAACLLRSQCTRARHGRTVKRHEKEALLGMARAQARSMAAWRDRRRRQHLVERSFADAANNHHFKRARWRRLWRQQIQDYLIASIQNVRILLAQQNPERRAAAALAPWAILTRNLLPPSSWRIGTFLASLPGSSPPQLNLA